MKLSIILFFFTILNFAYGLRLLKDFLQFNIAGHPVLHQNVEWPFDPNLGKVHSAEYQKNSGKLGEKAIERLGLGIDGNEMKRLIEQRKRDEGHLNGLDADDLSE